MENIDQAIDEILQIKAHLCVTLNETDVTFLGTNLRLRYELVSNQNPRGQEV